MQENGKKVRMGILGYGDFTKLMEKHLQAFCEMEIFRREHINKINDSDENEIKRLNSVDILVFAVTLNGLSEVCEKISKHLDKNILLADVMSVKVKPIDIISKYFTEHKILATHPIFGPQSAKDGLENLPIVLTNISYESGVYEKIKAFLSEELKLKVIEKTLEEHDREMAYIQGLSHLIGKALAIMDIKDFDTSTYSYKQLVKLESLVGGDSLELFKTIQNGNPYAKEVRKKFLDIAEDLEKIVEESEQY